MALDTLQGGLADPVFGAQAVFRATMDAFAAPGTIVDFGPAVFALAPLVPAAAALMATLADGDTPIWMADLTAPAACRSPPRSWGRATCSRSSTRAPTTPPTPCRSAPSSSAPPGWRRPRRQRAR